MGESVILHAERSFLVCRKPVGVECEHELPALLAEEMKCKVDSLYCVHRLDRAVGGVMVWARTPRAAAELSRQVQEKALQKAYLAVCSGIPTPDTGEMRDLLFKDSVKQKSFAVSSSRRGVKEALLDYHVLQDAVLNGSPAALVRVTLRTGRFHQLPPPPPLCGAAGPSRSRPRKTRPARARPHDGAVELPPRLFPSRDARSPRL